MNELIELRRMIAYTMGDALTFTDLLIRLCDAHESTEIIGSGIALADLQALILAALGR